MIGAKRWWFLRQFARRADLATVPSMLIAVHSLLKRF
jgi:hypothetical protein